MSTNPTYNGEYAGFLVAFMRESQALEKLQDMRATAAKRGHYHVEDALWEGIFALKRSLSEEAQHLQKRGQLLLAWTGSKALERIAA